MTFPTYSAAEPVGRLVEEFHKLPGIGPKTAQRLTYHLVRMPQEEAAAYRYDLVRWEASNFLSKWGEKGDGDGQFFQPRVPV